jgi:hypothetical protein
MSNPDLTDVFERRYRWQVRQGIVLAIAGIGYFIFELLLHRDIWATGFDWADGWAAGFCIAFGTWSISTAGCRRSKGHGVFQKANAAEVYFTIEVDEGEYTCFYVQARTKGVPQAGWMDWRSRVQDPYPTSRLRRLAGSELRGTVWFDFHSTAPVAARINDVTILLEKGESTAFQRL